MHSMKNLHLEYTIKKLKNDLKATKAKITELERKNDKQHKGLIEENKRLRVSINDIRPNGDCCICLEHKELSLFKCLAPCGHMICTEVISKH